MDIKPIIDPKVAMTPCDLFSGFIFLKKERKIQFNDIICFKNSFARKETRIIFYFSVLTSLCRSCVNYIS